MNVGRLNKRITFQKCTVEDDKYKNRKPTWKNYFTCWATVKASGRRSEETHNAAVTSEEQYIDVTVRWSSETRAINSKEHRIVIDDNHYNILSCDNAGYYGKMRVFTCALEPR